MPAHPIRSALLALATAGCGAPSPSTDTAAPSGGDDAVDTADLEWSGDLDDDTDLFGLTLRRAGTADVVQGVDWQGTETLEVLDTDAGTVLCSYVWPTASIQPAVGCDECQFAFEIEYGDATLVAGTCEDVGTGTLFKLGYAAVAWSDAEGGDVAAALFIVVNRDDWVLASHTEDGVAQNTWDGASFTYALPDVLY